MRLNLTLRAGFALLLTLLLPLQGYAAMPACGQHDQTALSAANTAASQAIQHHCAPESTLSHHHSCDNGCCGAAIALTSVRWSAPLQSASQISNAVFWSPPTVTLDRLDRPPRIPA